VTALALLFLFDSIVFSLFFPSSAPLSFSLPRSPKKRVESITTPTADDSHIVDVSAFSRNNQSETKHTPLYIQKMGVAR
jgi:hypothetical protein